jgi:hypothetical protein
MIETILIIIVVVIVGRFLLGAAYAVFALTVNAIEDLTHERTEYDERYTDAEKK